MILGFDWVLWLGVFIGIPSFFVCYHGCSRVKLWNNYCRALDAIKSGNMEELYVAPPPKSLYDFYIDRITQDFILNQYEKVAQRWFGYRSGFGERDAAQEIAGIEHEKVKSKVRADIAQENKRRDQADYEREKLGREDKTEKDEAKDLRERFAQYAARHTELTGMLARQEGDRFALDLELNDLEVAMRRIRIRLRELGHII